MKIVSWNVNGLRTLGGVASALERLDADVVCVQETRLRGARDGRLEEVALVPGYSSYFSFCEARSGYSGVATYVKDGPLTPVDAGEGLQCGVGGATPLADRVATKAVFERVGHEGRVVITDHVRFVLVNVYAPACGNEPAFRVGVLGALRLTAQALQAAGRYVILAGDFNVIPQPIDTAEPPRGKELAEWLRSASRVELRRLMREAEVVDAFRALHPYARDTYTCWHTVTRARENNAGVRIDYLLVSRELAASDLSHASVHAEVKGSDHAPTSATLTHMSYNAETSRAPPPFCARYLPQLSRTQASIVSSLRAMTTSSPARSSETRSVDASLGKPSLVRDASVPPPSWSIMLRPPDVRRKRPASTAGDGVIQRKQQKIEAFFPVAQCSTQTRSSPSRCERAGMTNATEGHRRVTCMQGVEEQKERVERSAARKTAQKSQWNKVFNGAPKAPICRHREICKLKRVTKAGENKGRTFWSCTRAGGKRGDKEANCNFFQWAPFSANKPLPDPH